MLDGKSLCVYISAHRNIIALKVYLITGLSFATSIYLFSQVIS